jgi:hypothetical protein
MQDHRRGEGTDSVGTADRGEARGGLRGGVWLLLGCTGVLGGRIIRGLAGAAQECERSHMAGVRPHQKGHVCSMDHPETWK